MSGKKEYVQNIEDRLRQWQRDIDDIKSKADRVLSQHRIEFDRQVNLLDAKHELAREKLKELKSVSSRDWDALKSSLDGIWNEIENAIDSANAKIE